MKHCNRTRIAKPLLKSPIGIPSLDIVAENIKAFAAGEHTGHQFVCIVGDEASAREVERSIRTLVRDVTGTRLAFDARLNKGNQ